MKANKISLLLVLSFVVVVFGCKDLNNPINHSGDTNLISNSSFEISGEPSLNGWQPSSTDTVLINFSNNVPQNGGNYSVKLKNEWSFPGSISTNVIPSTGTHRYRISAWAKVFKSGTIAGGEMSILTRSGGATNFRKSHQFSDTSWTLSELIDTLTLTSTDTVIIRLRGNIDQFSNGHILFDLCKFEKMD